MLQRLRVLANSGEDFALESTLASRSFAPFTRSCRERGYRVHLLYVWLTSPELAIERVVERVLAGGHDIPENTIRRRYQASLRNFAKLYLPLADSWEIYDNSGDEPLQVAQSRAGRAEIYQPEIWEAIHAANE